MKIKQTVKIILVGLVFATGVSSLFVAPTYAATCAGVDTSVIGCSQKGACDGGEDPFEGEKPKGAGDADQATADANQAAAEADYQTKYGHPYGLCAGGVAPNNSIERSGVWGLLLMVINILTAGVGIAAVAGIVYGSVLYTSAGGNPEQVKKAMGIISNVIIGIVAYALMYALLNFLIPGGLFD